MKRQREDLSQQTDLIFIEEKLPVNDYFLHNDLAKLILHELRFAENGMKGLKTYSNFSLLAKPFEMH